MRLSSTVLAAALPLALGRPIAQEARLDLAQVAALAAPPICAAAARAKLLLQCPAAGLPSAIETLNLLAPVCAALPQASLPAECAQVADLIYALTSLLSSGGVSDILARDANPQDLTGSTLAGLIGAINGILSTTGGAGLGTLFAREASPEPQDPISTALGLILGLLGSAGGGGDPLSGLLAREASPEPQDPISTALGLILGLLGSAGGGGNPLSGLLAREASPEPQDPVSTALGLILGLLGSAGGGGNPLSGLLAREANPEPQDPLTGIVTNLITSLAAIIVAAGEGGIGGTFSGRAGGLGSLLVRDE